MTRDRQNDSGQRDTTMARLVAAALETQTAMPTGDACPDADILAAYADRALGADEIARSESHFADCARCQNILAVLTVSAEAPLTQQEIARLGQLVSKTAAPAESAVPVPRSEAPAKRPQIVRPTEHRVPWRWVVPVFGIAAAVAMWFVLRPTPPVLAPSTQIMAEKTAIPPPPGQQEQMAQANVPPQPAAPAPTQEKGARSLDRGSSSAANAPAKQKDALRDEAGDEARNNNGVPNEDKKVASSGPAVEADRSAPTTAAGNGGAIAGASAAPPTAAPPAVALQSQVARQAPAPQPVPSGGGQLSAENAVKSLPLAGRNTEATLFKAATAPIVFGTADRGVEWRIGAGGRIERSTDRGKTWQPQSSGVTSDLLAGAAVSDKIAWIVGRADTILRTTDGEHWQRATPPALVPPNGAVGGRVDAIEASPDWTGVQATDALHATVVSADGRHYATSDGGRSWTPQQ